MEGSGAESQNGITPKKGEKEAHGREWSKESKLYDIRNSSLSSREDIKKKGEEEEKAHGRGWSKE